MEWEKMKFTLTKEHLKLLRRMNVYWEDSCYEGAPAIDQKRPYGNSDVISDIAEIIGVEKVEADDGEFFLPKGTRDKCEKLHTETERALQVVLASGSFEPGEYQCDQYHSNWEKFTTTPTTSIEVERLEELEETEKLYIAGAGTWAKQQARITELEKQIEEAGKDTKRLDWLDEYSDMILCPTGYGENTWMVTSHNDKDADGKTIREAIDKAMD
jgi:hypothetical protein